jgi:uncharacterized protein
MIAAIQEEHHVTKQIDIAADLKLPAELVTQTIAILARKRSGKSFTARRIAEQLFRAGQQVVVVDPKGDWWGMRSSADGKGPGLGFLILGGEHGDLPLEVGSGELVARLVVEERVSVILDLSMFRKHEVAKFMTDFAENLYRLKAREVNRTPVMVIIDEADAVAPQKPQHGEERMLGAVEDWVRRGGQRGIGCTFVTQRSAVLNKNVLTQAQVMVALRTIAPQDLKAMDEWIDVHGTPEQRARLMESLPSLPQGHAWFWSPGWPTADGIFQRVHVSRIETFDSGATPKPGEKRVEPKKRADVDLEALRRQMAETVERQKASDPKLLQRRVAELERELAKASRNIPEIIPSKVERVEVPVLKDAQVKRLELAAARLVKAAELAAAAAHDLRPGLAAAAAPLPAAARPAAPIAPARRLIAAPAPRAAAATPPAPGEVSVGNSGLRRMLIALAQRPHGLTNQQIGVRAGVSSRSGTFSTYLGRARSQGWIDGRGTVRITDAGLAALGHYDPLPEGAELAAYWIAELGGGAARMLRALVDAYPNALTNEQLGAAAQISHVSGTFSTYLGRLRALELVTGRGELRASEELAP